MSPDFDLILEDCLARMRVGSDLESCLSLYPAYEKELRPLLSEAAYLRSIPAPKARPVAKEAGRQRMLAAFDQQSRLKNFPQASTSVPARYPQRKMKLALGFAFSFVFLLIFTGAFLMLAGILTVKASASAIPGDPLYGVKRAWEKIQLAMPIQDQDRQQLQSKFTNERRVEIAKLVRLHRDVGMNFDGVLEQVSPDYFVVSGIKAQITSKTIIEGIPLAGHKVKMRLHVQSDGQLIAQKLHVEDPDPHGTMPAVAPTLTPQPTSTMEPSTTPTSTIAPSASPTLTIIPLVVPPLNCDDDDCGDDDGEDDDSEDDDDEDDDDEEEEDDEDDDGGDDELEDDESPDDDSEVDDSGDSESPDDGE